jgi:hypothetical protein
VNGSARAGIALVDLGRAFDVAHGSLLALECANYFADASKVTLEQCGPQAQGIADHAH